MRLIKKKLETFNCATVYIYKFTNMNEQYLITINDFSLQNIMSSRPIGSTAFKWASQKSIK